MFGENLKAIRVQKGLSQEELAVRLHVVRQTISKWEKNRSVPDAELLIRLAELLEVPVSELLDIKRPQAPQFSGAVEEARETENLAQQLARINEQLAVRNRREKRIWKVCIVLAAAIAAVIVFRFLDLVLDLI